MRWRGWTAARFTLPLLTMAKERSVFVCQSCGAQAARWLGRCTECGEWNTLVEERLAAAPKGGGRVVVAERRTAEPITGIAPATEPRSSCGIGELDRVLGGGVVPGSVILIGGDPGIGKSTLVLQALAQLARRGRALYVTGEESPQQVKMRADRLGITEPTLLVLAETNVEAILEQARAVAPSILAVDSIQTVFTEQFASAPGSIGQVRESAAHLVQFAKRSGQATILVGHVTKEGAFAGPRVLEHMVDTVLYFEGDRGHSFRILRAVKNRFGSTNEIGVFEMKEQGLQAVANPSALFLAERPVDVPGSVVVASMEGTRPILVELQALVSPSSLGTARRTTLGMDHNRVALLVAILEKKMGLQLTGQDIFLNVAGGVRLDEPAADLGALVAVASSFLDKPVDPHTLIVGEVGLAGEVRAIGQAEARVREGSKLGFKRCVLPESSRRQLPSLRGVEVRGVASLNEAWEILF
jgi:DNA repair protein RadA/Sms